MGKLKPFAIHGDLNELLKAEKLLVKKGCVSSEKNSLILNYSKVLERTGVVFLTTNSCGDFTITSFKNLDLYAGDVDNINFYKNNNYEIFELPKDWNKFNTYLKNKNSKLKKYLL